MINVTSPNDSSIMLARLRYEELLAQAEKEYLISKLRSKKESRAGKILNIEQILIPMFAIYVIFQQIIR